MAERINITSGVQWEDIVGYSRAVRVGNVIEISGTVATDENGNVVGKKDPYEQTKYVLTKIADALTKAGASLQHVVRTRMYVTDISQWQEYGRAHVEVFGRIKPCTSMIEVSSLIGPDYMIEIEATAIVEK